MEHIPSSEERERELPQEAPVLADWIDEELGDEELAQFLRDHPEGLELCTNGESILPTTVFELVQDTGEVSEENGIDLLEHLHEQGMLPETTISRVVGNLSETEKEKELLRQEWLVARRRMRLFPGEEKKKNFEVAMIDYANEALDLMRTRFGVPGFHVPPEAVRFTDEVPFFNEDAVGEFGQYEQEAHTLSGEHPVHEMAVLLHEMTHFKSYGAIMVDQDKYDRVSRMTYRVGLNIYSRDRKKKYLTGLNEAVTEETSNRLMNAIPEDHPLLGRVSEAYHHISRTQMEKHSEDLAKEKLKPYWFVPSRREHGSALRLGTAYSGERIVMGDMFDKLYERNPERFLGKSREEAHEELFEMLQKAMFTGNILPFGRLFNATFGAGKFRAYGHLQSLKEQEEFVRDL